MYTEQDTLKYHVKDYLFFLCFFCCCCCFFIHFICILQEIVNLMQHQRSSSNFCAWFIELGRFSIVMHVYFKYYWVPTLTFWPTIFSSTLILQFIYLPLACMQTNPQCNQILKAYSKCTSIFWANNIQNYAFRTLLCISFLYSFDMTFPFL